MNKLTQKTLIDLVQAELSKLLDLDTLEEDDDPRPFDNVMEPMRKLAKGVMQEEYIVVRKQSLLELVQEAQLTETGRAVIDRQLLETNGVSDAEAQSFCMKRGYRTYAWFLRAVSKLNSAQKGKLEA